MKILALSGSLRAASINTALLRAAGRLAPLGMAVQLFEGLGDLPLFNPDLAIGELPAVLRLRDAVAGADALIIASPEYAHGVSGVLKNALDWLVSDERFLHKPVALLNASPRATHALAALRETLVTMSARMVEPACVALPLLGAGLEGTDIAEAEEISAPLRSALAALQDDLASKGQVLR